MVLIRMFSEYSYIRRGPIATPIQVRGVALSLLSLIFFPNVRFKKCIFPKLDVSLPPIFNTLFSCKLESERKPTKKFVQQQMCLFSIGLIVPLGFNISEAFPYTGITGQNWSPSRDPET